MDELRGRGVWLWLWLNMEGINFEWGLKMEWFDCLPLPEATKEAFRHAN